MKTAGGGGGGGRRRQRLCRVPVAAVAWARPPTVAAAAGSSCRAGAGMVDLLGLGEAAAAPRVVRATDAVAEMTVGTVPMHVYVEFCCLQYLS
ncbi:hypothetical protein TPA0905_31580 [Streptomyces olivaceus]|nr:hypothetical protein TPA0905_31580 [Streptomyces olivaceus]